MGHIEKWEEILEEFIAVGAEDNLITDSEKENWKILPNEKVEYYIDLDINVPNNAAIMHCISIAIHLLDYKYKSEASIPRGYYSGGKRVETDNFRLSFIER